MKKFTANLLLILLSILIGFSVHSSVYAADDVQGEASGMAVGLPDGQMGNSEVGHTNMGAGRIVYQMLVKISKSIQDGDFFENKALVAAMENCKKNDSALHLMGLLSPGGVHSHMEHLYGLLEMAREKRTGKGICSCLP